MNAEPAPAAPRAPLAATYVLPLRSPEDVSAGLTGYLRWLASKVDLVVVDGSIPQVFAAHGRAWRGVGLRHVAPHADIDVLNGKVAGVLTGLRLACFDRVVVADDDVRYHDVSLERVVTLLDTWDIVRPQNYFEPCPWHARWDTARSLLNRVGGGDYPGTLAVRACAVPDGYDGNVLFENLELIRTVRARGGRMTTPLDCYVRRLPPTVRRFCSQRVRQAYDDFAQPPRLAAELLIVPAVVASGIRRRWLGLAAFAGTAAGLAESGRRVGGGAAVFPPSASVLAPLWLLERGVCSWLAVACRLGRGGCAYGGTVIRRAATPSRRLAERSP